MAFDITEATAKMSQLQEQIKKLKEEANVAGKAAFTDACKSLFAEHPELKGIRWRQYTPYFNDGDECVFSVNSAYMRVVGVPGVDDSEDAGDYEDGFVDVSDRQWDGKEFVPAPEPLPTMVANIRAVLNLLDEDTCLELFGDHAQVTVTAGGVDVDEYEHD